MPKGRNGNIENTGPKEALKPAGQTSNSASLCQSTLQISNSFQLCWVQHTSFSWASSTPCYVSRFPQQVSHGSGISNIMGFPGLTFTASCNVLSVPPCRDTPDTRLAPEAFLSHGGRAHNLFLVSLTLKSEPWGQSCQVLLLGGAGTSPSFKYISISFLASRVPLTAFP